MAVRLPCKQMVVGSTPTLGSHPQGSFFKPRLPTHRSTNPLNKCQKFFKQTKWAARQDAIITHSKESLWASVN